MLSESAQSSAERLRALRQQVGLSQRELARRAGVAPNTVRSAERKSVPGPDSRRRIATALARAAACHAADIAAGLRADDNPELGLELEAQLWPDVRDALAA
jgi:transcriptional regulator with XRE-family HTH domain